MSTEPNVPDAATVREIARDCVADYIDDARDIAAHVMGHFGMGVPGDVYAWTDAVRADLRAVVPSWPDEQPQDDDREHARTFLANLREDIRSYHGLKPGDVGDCPDDGDLTAIAILGAALNAWAPTDEAEQPQDDGGVRAVAEAVSILEGMLDDDAWAYDAGRACNVLLDCFARELDALEARDAKAEG